MVWQVFTARKSFADPVIGNITANKLGLHGLRIRLADAFLALRRWLLFRGRLTDEMRQFNQDGYLALSDFLPQEDYAALKQSALKAMEDADSRNPVPEYREAGFGKPHLYEWGFDRCDGSTVNRFYGISSDVLIERLSGNERFRQLIEYAAGCRFEPKRLLLYRLLQGADSKRADNQRQIHRDTFHSCIKFWFSLSEVKADDGPLHYLPGSHKFNRARWQWEKHKSITASVENKGGAFRCSPNEARAQYGQLPQALTVPENTLVLADVRGWHNRGHASPGCERLAVYGSFRPSPFWLPRVRPLDSRGQ